MVGRIAYLRETHLAMVGEVVGSRPRTRGVAYNDDMMPKNRNGAQEDCGLTRTYEGEFRNIGEVQREGG